MLHHKFCTRRAVDTSPALPLLYKLSSQHVCDNITFCEKNVLETPKNDKIHPTGKKQSLDSNMDFLTVSSRERGRGRERLIGFPLSFRFFSL